MALADLHASIDRFERASTNMLERYTSPDTEMRRRLDSYVRVLQENNTGNLVWR